MELTLTTGIFYASICVSCEKDIRSVVCSTVFLIMFHCTEENKTGMKLPAITFQCDKGTSIRK